MTNEGGMSISKLGRRLAPLIVATAAWLPACDGAAPPEARAPRVASVELVGPDSLETGTRATVGVVLRDSAGAALAIPPEATWTAEPPAILRLVDGAAPGTVEARTPGVAVVAVTSHGVVGRRTVRVISPPARLVSLAIEGPDSLELGAASYYFVTARDAVGNYLYPGENVRADTSIGRLSLSVSLSDTSVLRVTAASPLSPLGAVDARRVGTTVITAVANGLTARKVVRVTPVPPNAPPTPVAGGLAWSAVEAGDAFTCGLTTAGAVHCWGLNDVGQLGFAGAPAASLVPVRIAVPFPATRLSVGASHACAVGSDGAAYCWGSGELGKRGLLDASAFATGINRVAVAERIVDVAAGSLHTCAVSADGGIWCWGLDEQGQLGAPATTEVIGGLPYYARASAGRLQTGVRLTSITAGPTSNCGLAADGAAYCWGSTAVGTGVPLPEVCRFFARTGGGPNAVRSVACTREPLAVAGGHRFTALDAGPLATCGVRADGAVLCWSGILAPALVPGVRARAVSVGDRHVCAVTTDDAVVCWGANDFGQLGVTGVGGTTAPVAPVPPPASPAVGVTAGGTHTCAVTRAGGAVCWGNPRNGRLGQGPTP